MSEKSYFDCENVQDAISKLTAQRNSWIEKTQAIQSGNQSQIWKRMNEIHSDQFLGDPNLQFRCPVDGDIVSGWSEAFFFPATAEADYLHWPTGNETHEYKIGMFIICEVCGKVFAQTTDQDGHHFFQIS